MLWALGVGIGLAVLALAFGILLIVGLVVAGSLWIMAHLNANMMPGADVISQGMTGRFSLLI